MDWFKIGAVAPRSLAATRLQLHYGALILGSVAHSLLGHAEDDSHSNLGYDKRYRSLGTHVLAEDKRLHLDLPDSTLVVRREAEDLARFALAGQTIESALAWVSEQVETVALRAYPDFPEHDLANGGTFDAPNAACGLEIAHWFGNATTLIGSLHGQYPAMTKPRVWPHHFDLDALLPLVGTKGHKIGVGISPGDAHYDQPYFYTSPYPKPDTDDLPQLALGHWHTKGFLSAILTAEDVLQQPAHDVAILRYFIGAIGACRSMLI